MPYGQVNADVIGTSVAGSNLGAGNASIMKNRIINGAMVIDQRNAGASITPLTSGSWYATDRFQLTVTQSSKFTSQQSSTTPTGFNNSVLITSSSAYSVTSTDAFILRQIVEGYNFADCNWGTANAKTVTLSFWVQSSLTGTFGGSLANSDSSRSYPFTYTISSANTWEQKTITITGDTTGTWISATNGRGIIVNFGLGVGSTYLGTAGAWAGANYISATGATSVVGTNGATFYITGVQLEVGSSATGFEYVNYQTSLANCQRYFETSFDIGTAPANNTIGYYQGIMQGTNSNTQGFPFKVMKRNQPTMTYYSSVQVASPTAGQWQYTNSSGTWVNGVATQTNRSSMSMFSAYVNSTGIAAGQAACVSGGWTADSEL